MRDALPPDVRSVWINRAGLGWSEDVAVPADEVNEARAAYAAEWKAALGNRLEVVRLEGANHVNMITKPDYAATVAAAINRVAVKQ
ncbi:MAG: hypothetical protein EAZ30_11615 [Betaproteobacteria bacterium]|nr:MAG: hypothetical protein EAZ30_11615 [Betaproteobacteria bacterium]